MQTDGDERHTMVTSMKRRIPRRTRARTSSRDLPSADARYSEDMAEGALPKPRRYSKRSIKPITTPL